MHKQTHFLVTRSNLRDARIKLHRNFRNLCFQVSFSQNFQLAASLFYSIIRNFSYFRPKGCCCFYPVSCVFLLHMGVVDYDLCKFGEYLENLRRGWQSLG